MTFPFGSSQPSQTAITSKLNAQQMAVIDAPVSGTILVDAGAGCGKTSGVILPRAEKVCKEKLGKTLLLAYNRSIMDELNEKIASVVDPSVSRYIEAMTSHKLALKLVMANKSRLGLPKDVETITASWQMVKFVKEWIKEDNANFAAATRMRRFNRHFAELEEVQLEALLMLEDFSHVKRVVPSEIKAGLPIVCNIWNDVVDDFCYWVKANRRSRGKLLFLDYMPLALELPDSFFEGYNYDHILVDEAQDLSFDQHAMIGKFAKFVTSILFVGDIGQCLPVGTMVTTDSGDWAIEDLRVGDKVQSAIGNGNVGSRTISKIRVREVNEDLVTINTRGGKSIVCTDEHSIFTRIVPSADCYHVYMTYKESLGYRIGVTKGYWQEAGLRSGIDCRSRQEGANSCWVLRVCESKGEALSYEEVYSLTYGIPECRFKADPSSSSVQVKQIDIDRVFSLVDSRSGAVKLSKDFHLDLSSPHWSYNEIGRRRISINYLSDTREPYSYHTVRMETPDESLHTKLKDSGFPSRLTKKAVDGACRFRVAVCRKSYEEARTFGYKLSEVSGLDVSETFSLTSGKSWEMTTAKQVYPGMQVAVLVEGKLVHDEVLTVSRSSYNGLVYDLDVEGVHNYVANGVAVHNCIYRFAGAQPALFSAIPKNYSNCLTFPLETNYRSTQAILDLANSMLKTHIGSKIQLRPPKIYPGVSCQALFAPTTPEELVDTYNLEVGSYTDWLVQLQEKGVDINADKEVAFLYRNNADAIGVELALIRKGIPYKSSSGSIFSHAVLEDMMCYIRFCREGADRSYDDWLRIVNHVKYLGKLTAEESWSTSSGNPAMLHKPPVACRTGRQRQLYKEVLGTCAKVTAMLKQGDLMDCLKWLIAYLSKVVWDVKYASDPEARRDATDLSTMFISWVSILEEPADDLVNLVKRIKAHVARGEGITLGTIHKSKGLEYGNVGLVDVGGKFPSRHVLADPDEEACIFYVAETRAKNRLCIFVTATGEMSPALFKYLLPYGLSDFICPAGRLAVVPGTYSDCNDCPMQANCLGSL